MTRVLLVDDDFEFANGLTDRLSKKGMDVQFCLSGIDAIRKLEAESFDVAVLDVRMPEMDGLALLDRVKTLAPKMPAILLTGMATIQTAEEGLRKGAYDFLVKPIRVDSLAQKIIEAAASV